jgi:hypothetical protein
MLFTIRVTESGIINVFNSIIEFFAAICKFHFVIVLRTFTHLSLGTTVVSSTHNSLINA